MLYFYPLQNVENFDILLYIFLAIRISIFPAKNKDYGQKQTMETGISGN